MNNLAIFFSGRGTNMQALLKHTELHIKLLLCNNKQSASWAFAQQSNIKSLLIEGPNFEQQAYDALEKEQIDFIALAGFTHILSKAFVDKYKNRIFNIHPSLLPLFKGKYAQKQAMDAKAKITGCTVHLVNEKIDDGPILAQAIVPILANDDLHSLEQRILKQEHLLYAKTIHSYIEKFAT